jgi:pSer/pThr/pTyr-binding forkhead associated (FHA) protein
MATYVSEYVQDLHRQGADRMMRELVHSVLILQGLTGTLREPGKSGTTVITDLNETVTLSKLVGRVFPLVKNRTTQPGPILVGRGADCDVTIPDYSVSSRHCYFVFGGRDVVVADCGSTNGTFVEGRQIPARQKAPLQGGEKLVVGRFAFLFLRPMGFMDYLARQP